MKNLLLMLCITALLPIAADDKISNLEAEIANLKNQNEQRLKKEALAKEFSEGLRKKTLGLGLLCVAGGAVTLTVGWGAVLGFFAVIGNGTTQEWLKAFSVIGEPALAVAGTSGYFGSKLVLGGAFGLLKKPVKQ